MKIVSFSMVYLSGMIAGMGLLVDSWAVFAIIQALSFTFVAFEVYIRTKGNDE